MFLKLKKTNKQQPHTALLPSADLELGNEQ